MLIRSCWPGRLRGRACELKPRQDREEKGHEGLLMPLLGGGSYSGVGKQLRGAADVSKAEARDPEERKSGVENREEVWSLIPRFTSIITNR